MGIPDNDEIEREAGARALMQDYSDVIGPCQAENLAHTVLSAARIAKIKELKKRYS